jgi:hypothetical protein
MGHLYKCGQRNQVHYKIVIHTDLNIAYRTYNGLLAHLNRHTPFPVKFTLSGVYKPTCPDCGRTYVGQTYRDFRTRFNEHRRNFLYNNQSYKFAQHLLQHEHSFGHLQNIMQVPQFQEKSSHRNTLERFHICKEAASDNHLNDDHTSHTNNIFIPFLMNSRTTTRSPTQPPPYNSHTRPKKKGQNFLSIKSTTCSPYPATL